MSNEQKLREIIRKLLNRARALDDCGAGYESWQSDELMAEIAEAEQALATTEPEPAGMPKLPEPDSYEFQHEETGNTMFVDRQQVEWGFEKNNPRLQKIAGAYTTSQMRAYGEQCWKAGYKHGAWGDKPAVNQQLTTEPVDEREAFEKWLGIKPCGAAHDFGWAAWQARAAMAQVSDINVAESFTNDTKDAERYRWLADSNNYYEAINLISDGSLTEDALGKAIDAAMAKGVKG